MSIYNLHLDIEYLDVPYHRSPTFILHDAPLPMNLEEVHSSSVMENILSERNSVIQEENHPSSYNIDELFNAFTFNLWRKEVSWKRVRSVKQNDGTMKEVQEDEVLFEKTDEDPVTVATTLAALTQATAHNVTVLNEKLLETKSENLELKDEIINL